jgi:hypothetical protein
MALDYPSFPMAVTWWDNRPLVDGSAQAGLEHRGGPRARR